MLSLLSTLVSVAKRVKEFMSETVLYVLFGFCLLGTQLETLYAED